MPTRCEAASWARGWVVPRLQKEAGQAPADERDPSRAGPPAACHAALLTSNSTTVDLQPSWGAIVNSMAEEFIVASAREPAADRLAIS